MFQNTVYYSAKGGQGVTVSAAAHALTVAHTGVSVLLVDFSGGDTFAALGMPEPAYGDAEPREVVENLRVLSQNPDAVRLAEWQLPFADVYVFDAPASDVAAIAERWDAAPVLVVRPCYMALRNAVALDIVPTRAVLVAEPGRSLRPDDVADVLNVEVTTIPYDPAVARAVDAGLLASRLPRVLVAVAA